MRAVLALIATLLLAGCASEDEDYPVNRTRPRCILPNRLENPVQAR
jgi:type IV pilus biogenesis protein CpaD/CtpE